MSKRKKEVEARVHFGRVEAKDIKAVQEVVDQQIKRNIPTLYAQGGPGVQVEVPKVPKVVEELNALDTMIDVLAEDLHSLFNFLEPVLAGQNKQAKKIHKRELSASRVSGRIEAARLELSELTSQVELVKLDLEI